MNRTRIRIAAAAFALSLVSLGMSCGAWANERGDGPRASPRAQPREDGRDHERGAHHREPVRPACPIGDAIAFFDASVANGSLVGRGHGASARGHLRALRSILAAADHALREGKARSARYQLRLAYARTVGTPKAPAFVAGPAAAALADQITALIGCLTGDRPPSAQVVNNSSEPLARALVGAVAFTENLAMCGNGCSTGFLDVAEGSNVIAVQLPSEALARQLGALAPFKRNTFYAVNVTRSSTRYCAELWIRAQTSSTFNDDATRTLVASVCEPALPPSQTLSGTAAAGAPIVGVVTVRDSSVPFQERSAPIGDLGRYSVDVTGMTGPFMLRADGTVGLQGYSIYSAAVAGDVGGTVNITPLTDLIISNIAGQVAAAAYASGNFGGITPTNLAAAQAELLTKLAPVLLNLGISSSVDILRATFNADHTGLDLLLDALRVEVDPVAQSAIITNIINHSQTVDNFAALDPGGVMDGSGTAQGIAEWDQIRNVFNAWTAAFAIELPSMATLSHLFDPTFRFQGSMVDEFLTMLTTDPSLVGLNVSNNVVLESIDTNAFPYAATVSFVPVFAGRTERAMRMNLAKASATSPWLMTGDGRVGEAMVIAYAEYRPNPVNRCVGAPAVRTGLKVEITAPLDLNVDYALVKGPGLPIAGALWFKVPNDDHFHVAAPGAAYNGAATAGNCGDAYFILDDTAIGDIPANADYTIELWDDRGTTATGDDVKLYTYAEVLPKPPVTNGSLATPAGLAASFATLTPETEASAAAVAVSGGTLNATWVLPANMLASQLYFSRSETAPSGQYGVNQALLATATSASIAGIPPPTGTVTFYGIHLTILDVFGRAFQVGVGH